MDALIHDESLAEVLSIPHSSTRGWAMELHLKKDELYIMRGDLRSLVERYHKEWIEARARIVNRLRTNHTLRIYA